MPQSNGALRRRLNQRIFDTIEEVREQAPWLWTYNNERPDMANSGLTPVQKLVGYEVYEEENGAYAVTTLQRALLSEQCFNKPVVLHSDNSAPMKSQTLKVKLEELGVLPSSSRP